VTVIEDIDGLNCEYDRTAIPPEIPPFKSCCDCRLYANSTDQQPDFWRDLDNFRDGFRQ
jgi:hypothetical protein